MVAVSVIVPVRDDPAGVQRLLACLRTQTFPQDQFEIIIGDDGSEPESLTGIATADGRIRVLSGPPKTSYAARNRAARAARGPILAFCDADCSPQPEWLAEGLPALNRSDLVAGEVIFEPPARPTAWSLLTIDMFMDQERNVQFSRAVTANVFVRTSVFEDTGGFDESLASGGDYEFTRQAVSRGARLVHAPDAIIRHPTLDTARAFLRKVWFTNRWQGFLSARSGIRPELTSLIEFVPVLGVAIARRRALRPAAALSRARLAAAGLRPGLGQVLETMLLLYSAVACVAAAARIVGWWEGRRAMPVLRSPAVADPATSRARASSPARLPWLGFRQGALPNLVVIGAQKCGTSALHYYLGLHPMIGMSRRKELSYFIEERNWGRGVGWYRRQFDAANPVRGESSPAYAAFPRFPGVPSRMASLIPEARLILLVRDPIERIASQWVHNLARGVGRQDLRTELLCPESAYVSRSCYHLQLQCFLEHFDESQILVLDSNDLNHRRLHTLRRVFDFVGVDPDFYHSGFERRVHRSDEKRWPTRPGLLLQGIAVSRVGRLVPAPVWQTLGMIPGLSKPLPARQNVRDALSSEALERLRDDAVKLRTRTGMALDHWPILDGAGSAGG